MGESTRCLKIVFDGGEAGITVLQYGRGSDRMPITDDFLQRKFGRPAAHALRDALETISRIGEDEAEGFSLIKCLRGWERGNLRVTEVRVRGHSIRALSTIERDDGRAALIILMVEAVKGRGGYARNRERAMNLAEEAREAFRAGIEWSR